MRRAAFLVVASTTFMSTTFVPLAGMAVLPGRKSGAVVADGALSGWPYCCYYARDDDAVGFESQEGIQSGLEAWKRLEE